MALRWAIHRSALPIAREIFTDPAAASLRGPSDELNAVGLD
jgi:hypothetical protein